jgi:multiple sugar transport system substrate-binding protein/sn-glycerol 3-phosphate transport system substrate-binding protein
MVYSRGGKLISDDQKTWLFNGRQGLDSLTMHQNAIREGWGYRAAQANGDQNDFATGRAIFTLTSSSGFPFYKHAVDQGARFNWSVAIIPHATGAPPATVLYGASIAVFKSSPEKQLAAWMFLKYFSSPEVTADWSTSSGYRPVRTSALQSEVVQAAMRSSAPYGVAVNQIAQFGRPETSVRGTQDTRSYIEDAIVRVTTDLDTNPRAVLDDAARRGQQALIS